MRRLGKPSSTNGIGRSSVSWKSLASWVTVMRLCCDVMSERRMRLMPSRLQEASSPRLWLLMSGGEDVSGGRRWQRSCGVFSQVGFDGFRAGNYSTGHNLFGNEANSKRTSRERVEMKNADGSKTKRWRARATNFALVRWDRGKHATDGATALRYRISKRSYKNQRHGCQFRFWFFSFCLGFCFEFFSKKLKDC